ncbi:MAG: hypothetical protein WA118_12175 [Carboxydocellales bacterium]
MNIKGLCQTTAMGVMPHTDVQEAIKLALKLDIPYWPQLPRVSFYEDMYVQVTENFPGITIDDSKQKIKFSLEEFYTGMEEYVLRYEDEAIFGLSEGYSLVYRKFMEQQLGGYSAIRGQSIGPISFGMKITDADKKPIIYNNEVKGFLYEFIARKCNHQYRELVKKNPQAFVWVDEPGLEIIFGSFSGYPSEQAKIDFREFLNNIEGPKGVHLCGNPDWSFLLKDVDLDILSLDAFGTGRIFTRYVAEIKGFLDKGGIISWGIVPTLTEEQTGQSVLTLINKLEEFWDYLDKAGIPKQTILQQAWLAPARCCLINTDGTKSVERAFQVLQEVSGHFRNKYNLG